MDNGKVTVTATGGIASISFFHPQSNSLPGVLLRELGDIMWYAAQACIGLDISLEEVIQMNFEKLSSRYPEGAFSIERSENRKEGDL